MKKQTGRIHLHRESLRQLESPELGTPVAGVIRPTQLPSCTMPHTCTCPPPAN